MECERCSMSWCDITSFYPIHTCGLLNNYVASTHEVRTDDGDLFTLKFNDPARFEKVKELSTEVEYQDAEDGTSKPSISAFGIDEFFGRYKITSTLAHISSMLATKSLPRKMALLVAICENYQERSTVEQINKLGPVIEYIEDFFGILTDRKKQEKVFDAMSEMETPKEGENLLPDELLQSDFVIDPFQPLHEQIDTKSPTARILEKYVHILRPVLGLIALFMAALGIHKLIEVVPLGNIAANIVGLSKLIIAKRVIKSEIEGAIDELLRSLYSMCGAEYFSPAEMRLRQFSKQIEVVQLQTRRVVEGFKYDFFNAIYTQEIGSLTQQHKELESMYFRLTEAEKSTFNFRDRIQEINHGLNLIKERRITMIKACGGKQEPVRIWIAGRPGIGKTHLSKTLAKKLEGGKCTIYSRNVMDEYWSGYAGQAVCIWDDMAQQTDNKDIAEWHMFASDTSMDVIGAALEEKGTPFTSRYNIATSNFEYITSTTKVVDLLALNRRRDLLVYARNDELEAYKQKFHCDPSPAWYAEHPTQFFLLHPTAGFDGTPAVNVRSIRYGNEYGVFARVSLDEIVEIAEEMEKCKRECFRQILCHAMPNNPMVPTTPIEYNRQKFDMAMRFGGHKETRRASISKPSCSKDLTTYEEMMKHRDELSPGTLEDLSKHGLLKDEKPQALKLAPAITKSINRRMAIILMGPPGLGKTFLVHEAIKEELLHKVTMGDITPGWYKKLPLDKVIFFDDFTTNEEFFNAFRTCVVEYDSGEFMPLGLIGCMNPDTPLWQGDVIGQMCRRCAAVEFTPKSSWYFTKKTVPPDADFHERSAYFHISHHKLSPSFNAFWTFETMSASIREHMNLLATSSKLVTIEEFIIPRPPDWEMLIVMDLTFEQCNKMSMAVVVEKKDSFRGYTRYKGRVEPMSWFTSANYMRKLGPVLLRSYARGDALEFAKGINKEQHSMNIPVTIVKLADYELLFVSVDGKLNCGIIEQQLTQTMEIKENAIYLDGEVVPFDASNQQYEKVLRRIFKQDVPLTPEICNDEKLLEVKKDQNKILGFILDAIPYLSLLLKGLAIATLFATISEPSDDPKKDKEETESQDPGASKGAKRDDDDDDGDDDDNYGRERRRAGSDASYSTWNSMSSDPTVHTSNSGATQPTQNNVNVENRTRRVSFAPNTKKEQVIKPARLKKERRRANSDSSYSTWYSHSTDNTVHTSNAGGGVVNNNVTVETAVTKADTVTTPSITQPRVSATEIKENDPAKKTEINQSLELEVSSDSEPDREPWEYDAAYCARRLEKAKRRVAAQKRRDGIEDDESQKRDPPVVTQVVSESFSCKQASQDYVSDEAETEDEEAFEERMTAKRAQMFTMVSASFAAFREEQLEKSEEPLAHVTEIPPYIKKRTEEESAAYSFENYKNKYSIVTLENSIVPNADGTIVINKDGEFGFLFSGSVYFAGEQDIGNFTVYRLPISDLWTEVDIQTFRINYVVRGNSFDYQRAQIVTIDEHSLRAAVGRTFLTVHPHDVDFGCVFATMYAISMPCDIQAKKLRPDIAIEFVNQNSGMRLPEPCARTIKACFPNIYKNYNAPEGMIDGQIRSKISQLVPQIGSMLVNGQHCVHGIFVNCTTVITVAHYSSPAPRIRYRGQIYELELFDRDMKKDISTYISAKPVPGAKEITHMFMAAADLKKALSVQTKSIPGVLVVTDPDTSCVYCNHCEISAMLAASEQVDGVTGRYSANLGQFGVTGISLKGDCGSPLLMQNRQVDGKIVGIHRAGSQTTSVCSFITREFVQRTIARQVAPLEAPEALIPLVIPEEIQMRDVVKTCTTTGLALVGTLEKPIYCPDTTRLYRTGLHIDGVVDYEPSIMSTKDPRAEGGRLGIEALSRYAKPSSTEHVDRSEIAEAMMEIGNELATKITLRRRTTRVFTLDEAINVPPHMEYPNARPIDRSGSAGFPYNCGKTISGCTKGKFLMFDNDTLRWSFHGNVDGEKVMNRTNRLIEDAAAGIGHLNPFVAYLKDETVKHKKIYGPARKTRMFFSGSYEYLLAYRQYFLSAMLRITEMNHDVPVKVGVSSNMADWHHMAYRFLAKSSYGFASDVANFDSSVRTLFLEELNAVYDIIYDRTMAPGYDKARAEQIRRTLHRSVEGAYVIYSCNVFKLDQAMVSGCPGTAVENSFIIWALYYLVWKRLAKRHNPEVATYVKFRQAVELAVYGDDNMCTVAPGFEWFNFNTFQKEAYQLGFTITDAAKLGGDTPDYLPFSELEFLKRKFVECQNWYMGVLSSDSIGKAVAWIRDTGSYSVRKEHVPAFGGEWPLATNKELISTSLICLWNEMALHGKKRYYEWRDQILEQAGTLGLEVKIPSWKEACHQAGYEVLE